MTGLTLSTHVLDSAGGGGRAGVQVDVLRADGDVVATGTTDESGRIASLGSALPPGRYTVRWRTGGAFVVEAAATVELSEPRHYHLPLLASDHSATVYLGA